MSRSSGNRLEETFKTSNQKTRSFRSFSFTIWLLPMYSLAGILELSMRSFFTFHFVIYYLFHSEREMYLFSSIRKCKQPWWGGVDILITKTMFCVGFNKCRKRCFTHGGDLVQVLHFVFRFFFTAELINFKFLLFYLRTATTF